MLKQTPSQTVGPFFGFGLLPEQYGYARTGIANGNLVTGRTEGQRITIMGQVFDGAGDVIPDALIEIWQADSHGRYDHPADSRLPHRDEAAFSGFGRAGTGADPDGGFRFETIKPGSVDGVQAPHLNVTLFMRGLLTHVATRMYFSDEPDANCHDPVLLSVPGDRRSTLVATRADSGPGPSYQFDIHMQGARETVFFDV